jgi:xylulokinase
MALLLGFDLGTSSVKVLVTDERGSVLGRGMANYPMSTPEEGWVEQSPEEWWQALIFATRNALSELDTDQAPAAIGLSGQMHGTVLLGEDNRLLGPAIIWPDQRSVRQVGEITKLVGEQRLIAITGSTAATGFQSSSLRWIQQNIKSIWEQTSMILLPKDYLRWRLCGEFITDPSDAAGTGLFDGNSREWSRELLAALEIDPGLLPIIKPSAQTAGRLHPGPAKLMSLPEGIPVITGAADTAASLLGAGVISEGDLLVTISTGGQLISPTSSFITEHQGSLHTFCAAVEAGPRWYLMGATLAAGGSLRWLRDNVLNLDIAEGFERMVGWAEGSPVGSKGLIFTPYLVGDREDSQARGAFLGLTIRHGKADLIRSVLEGVVFSLYEKYLLLLELGVTPERIILSGGGARSKLWCQIVSDVFGLPVARVLVEEQSAYGAALLAGVGYGKFELGEGVMDWVKLGQQVEPDVKTYAIYQEMLPIFRVAHSIT